MKNWKGEIRTRNKPNREVLSVKVPLPPRPNTNNPTAQPECMNDRTTTTTPPNLTIETHSIFFPTENTQLPLALHGKLNIFKK